MESKNQQLQQLVTGLSSENLTLKTEIEKHKKEIIGLESNLNYLSEHVKDVKKIWMTKIQHEANDLFKKWADEWQQRFQEDGEAQMM